MPNPDPICRLTIQLENQEEVETLYEIVDFFVENGADMHPDSTEAWSLAVKLQEYIEKHHDVQK